MNDTTIITCLLAFVLGYLISSHLKMTIEGAGCDEDTNLKFDPKTKQYYPRKYFQGDTFYFDTDPHICIDTTKNCGEGKCYTPACEDICTFQPDTVISPQHRNKCEIPFHMTSRGSGQCELKGTDEMYLRNPRKLSSPPPTQQQLQQVRQIKQEQQIQQQQQQQRQQSPPPPPPQPTSLPPPPPPPPQIGPGGPGS